MLIHIQLQMALGQLGRIPVCFNITHKYSESEDIWHVVVTNNCEWRGVVCRPCGSGQSHRAYLLWKGAVEVMEIRR